MERGTVRVTREPDGRRSVALQGFRFVAPAVEKRHMSTTRSLGPRVFGTIALAAALPLAGCGTVALSEEARHAVHQVSVSPLVPATGTYSGDLQELDFDTRSAEYYAFPITTPIGLVLDLIDMGKNRKRKETLFQRRLQADRVDVASIVRQTFSTKLAEAKLFDAVVAEGGDGRFELEVEYGLDEGWASEGIWTPWLEVRGTLRDASTNVLWQQSVAISSDDERLPKAYHPLRQSGYLQKAYSIAATILTEELIAHLKGAS
jgi:hypothetical protein